MSTYLPSKFGLDYRNLTLAAQARSGQLCRTDAALMYSTPATPDPELTSYFKKRLDLSDQLYESVMSSPPRYWTEFPTYKKRFERFRPIFGLLARANLVPMSFYQKYCCPIKVS